MESILLMIRSLPLKLCRLVENAIRIICVDSDEWTPLCWPLKPAWPRPVPGSATTAIGDTRWMARMNLQVPAVGHAGWSTLLDLWVPACRSNDGRAFSLGARVSLHTFRTHFISLYNTAELFAFLAIGYDRDPQWQFYTLNSGDLMYLPENL